MTTIPELFARLPPTLFGPLTGPLAPLYWDVLARFYQQDFEGESSFLVRPVALEIAELALCASRAWLERREELLAPDPADSEEPAPTGGSAEAALARAAARRLVVRLEAAGWFYFEYRSSVGHVLNFHPYAARLLELMLRLARDEQPMFQGFAHSIATLLRPDTFAARPGLSLAEASRHTRELVRELKILDRNIFAFTRRLLDEVSRAAEVLEESFDRYQSAVTANYHRLKTVDNLYKWRGEILARLDAIERDALSLESATRWYAEQGSDLETARARVHEDLRVLRSQFESMAELT